MKFRIIFLTAALFFVHEASAQFDSSVFERIGKELATFKPDTTPPPSDKFTKKVNEVRALRGGFNIHEAIQFKIQEELSNKKITAQEATNLTHYFTSGKGKTALDNAVNHIYRAHFNYREMKKLVKFYRSSAGQKMATDFPFIMLKSLAAGEMIKKYFDSEHQK